MTRNDQEGHTMNETIDSPEQVEALPPGQWVIAADETEACLFDTHMGFPQRMWGIKGRSRVTSFVSTDTLPLPMHLADIAERDGHECQHRNANECGQCMRCGKPEVAERHELHFDAEGAAAFRAAARHNAEVTR